MVSANEIEKYAKDIGYSIKILVSNQLVNTVKPDIKFVQRNK